MGKQFQPVRPTTDRRVDSRVTVWDTQGTSEGVVWGRRSRSADGYVAGGHIPVSRHRTVKAEAGTRADLLRNLAGVQARLIPLRPGENHQQRIVQQAEIRR